MQTVSKAKDCIAGLALHLVGKLSPNQSRTLGTLAHLFVLCQDGHVLELQEQLRLHQSLHLAHIERLCTVPAGDGEVGIEGGDSLRHDVVDTGCTHLMAILAYNPPRHKLIAAQTTDFVHLLFFTTRTLGKQKMKTAPIACNTKPSFVDVNKLPKNRHRTFRVRSHGMIFENCPETVLLVPETLPQIL